MDLKTLDHSAAGRVRRAAKADPDRLTPWLQILCRGIGFQPVIVVSKCILWSVGRRHETCYLPIGQVKYIRLLTRGAIGARTWRQNERHARWLGLDFVRVEFEQRMYEPERQIELLPGQAAFTDAAAPMSLTIYTTDQLAHSELRVTVKHAQAQHGSLRNEPFLVIAYPGPPRDQVNLERYHEIANAGIDVIVPGNGFWDGRSNRTTLDPAAKVGMRAIVIDRRMLPWPS